MPASPIIKRAAELLPHLEGFERLCAEYDWHAEGMICAGLTHMLAQLVECDTVPGTPEHELAAAIVAGSDL